MPQAIITRLNYEAARLLNAAETKERLLAVGVQVVASSPEAFGAAIRADIERTSWLIRSAGITKER